MVAPEQLSELIGVAKVTTAPHLPASVFLEILANAEMIGDCVSATVTVNVLAAVFPYASVTLKVLVVIPKGYSTPDANPAI